MRYCKDVDDHDEGNKTNDNDANDDDGVRTVECGKETKIYPNDLT